MLIDISANVGHWPFRQTGYETCKQLLDIMDRYGVEISVVSNMNGIFYKDSQAANEELYSELLSDRRFRNRFIPFAVLNPIYAGWKRDLDICCNKLGFKGVRLYPQYHDYNLNDPACTDFVKSCRDKGLIVAFTIRMVDSRPRSWMDLSNEWSFSDVLPIIKAVPDAKYFISNISGGVILKNDEDSMLIRNSEILLDTSGRNIATLGSLLEKYGRNKFAFGTHYPILDYLTGLLRIESLRDNEAEESVKEMLRSGNARKFLGI
jgi:predicted TIM-barrel fold metal-dependent hydrolase